MWKKRLKSAACRIAKSFIALYLVPSLFRIHWLGNSRVFNIWIPFSSCLHSTLASLSPPSTCSHTPAFVCHSPFSLSLFITVSAVFSQRALARSIYRLRGIISRHCARNTHTHSKVRVTATPAAPARSAIELMMLGPRRFNNKPHYLQSALGSITTGCPPHLVVVLFSFPSHTHTHTLATSVSFFFFLRFLLFSPSRRWLLIRLGRRLTLLHRKCPRSDIKPL